LNEVRFGHWPFLIVMLLDSVDLSRDFTTRNILLVAILILPFHRTNVRQPNRFAVRLPVEPTIYLDSHVVLDVTRMRGLG